MSGQQQAPDAPRREPRSRRELALMVALAAVAGGLLLLLASRGWVSVRLHRPPPLPPLRRTISGSTAQPLLTPLGLVGLAGAVALLATRRLGRRIVGGLLAAAGILVMVRAVDDLSGISAAHALSLLQDSGPVVGVTAHANTDVTVTTAWVLTAVAAGALLCLAGVATIVRAGRWPMMGRKYERRAEGPAARNSAATDRSLWDALDRGDDPTQDDEHDPDEHSSRDRTR